MLVAVLGCRAKFERRKEVYRKRNDGTSSRDWSEKSRDPCFSEYIPRRCRNSVAGYPFRSGHPLCHRHRRIGRRVKRGLPPTLFFVSTRGAFCFITDNRLPVSTTFHRWSRGTFFLPARLALNFHEKLREMVLTGRWFSPRIERMLWRSSGIFVTTVFSYWSWRH